MHADQFVHVACFGERCVVGLLIKIGCASFVFPASGDGIVMKGKTIRQTMVCGHIVLKEGFEYGFSPLYVIGVRAAGNLADQFWIVDRGLLIGNSILADVSLISTIFIGIVLRVHISAAAPVFVSNAEEINLPRIRMTVLCAQICHRRDSAEGHVLDPF